MKALSLLAWLAFASVLVAAPSAKPKVSKVLALQVQLHRFSQVGHGFVEGRPLGHHCNLYAFRHIPVLLPGANDSLDGVLKTLHRQTLGQGSPPREAKMRPRRFGGHSSPLASYWLPTSA